MAKKSKYFLIPLKATWLNRYRSDGFLVVNEKLYNLFNERVQEKISNENFLLFPTGVPQEFLAPKELVQLRTDTKKLLEDCLFDAQEISFKEREILQKNHLLGDLHTTDGFQRELLYEGYGDCSAFEAIMSP